MPNQNISRHQAHRIGRVGERLEALLAVLDTLHGEDRRQPLPLPLAGAARRTLSEARAILGLPAEKLPNRPFPFVILTSALKILDQSKPLFRQLVRAAETKESWQSFPRRFASE